MQAFSGNATSHGPLPAAEPSRHGLETVFDPTLSMVAQYQRPGGISDQRYGKLALRMKSCFALSDMGTIKWAAFVVRCTATAVLAYAAAHAVNLDHPVWAVVSGLIVSQETARETRRSLLWRAVGTFLGTAVAVVAVLLMSEAAPLPLIMGLTVALCAGVARRWPSLRVCLWTAPLVI